MKFKKILAPLVFWYLGFWARLSLLIIKPKIVGVGGASGKTSLSHFLNLILSEKYKIRETEGKNSQTGVPLSILGISLSNYSFWDWFLALIQSPFKVLQSKKYEIFIAELGIDSPFPPNNMSHLLKIVKPEIAALTNINFEHSENFDALVLNLKGSLKEQKILDLTAREEGLLLKTLPKAGVAILNIDDLKIRELKRDVKANVVTVSLKEKADFQGNVSINGGFKLTIKKDNRIYAFSLANPIPLHFASSILEALAITENLGMPLATSIKILEKKFSLPPGRFRIFKGIKNTKILDSSYNSSLIPCIDALFVLSKMKGRKVAIVGDMRELGSMSKKHHEIVANELIKTTDLAILVGPLMQKYAAPILKRKNHNFYSFLTFSESKGTIKKVINKGDLILVKGSQNTLFLERAVEMLLRNPKDKALLCRRGRYWERIRQETP